MTDKSRIGVLLALSPSSLHRDSGLNSFDGVVWSKRKSREECGQIGWILQCKDRMCVNRDNYQDSFLFLNRININVLVL